MTMKKECIIPAGSAKPIGPYSPAVRVGDFVFTSGQIGMTPEGKMIEGGVEAQAKQVLANLKAVLEAAGASINSVIKTTIFMQDMVDYAVVNAVYGEVFGENPPARSAVAVAALPAGALVEIEAVAFVA
jgi:2-iminobutanoate/2-iminopropanoate deaminase